jgi:hypothetical protein
MNSSLTNGESRLSWRESETNADRSGYWSPGRLNRSAAGYDGNLTKERDAVT